MTEQRDRYGGRPEIATKATGFFRVDALGGRWWFVTPDGHGFVSVGVNHFDLSALKHSDNVHIFRDRYGSSDEQYIKKGIVEPLREWGFNTIGWTEDQVSGEWMDPKRPMRLCPEWHYHHYKTAQMPYIYNFVFAEIEKFNFKCFYPDVFSDDFAEWADYLARSVCVDMAEEPLLISYADVPLPDFISGRPRSWAEGLDLNKPSDLSKLKDTVRKYFQKPHDLRAAIRRAVRYPGMARRDRGRVLRCAPMQLVRYRGRGRPRPEEMVRTHQSSGPDFGHGFSRADGASSHQARHPRIRAGSEVTRRSLRPSLPICPPPSLRSRLPLVRLLGKSLAKGRSQDVHGRTLSGMHQPHARLQPQRPLRHGRQKMTNRHTPLRSHAITVRLRSR